MCWNKRVLCIVFALGLWALLSTDATARLVQQPFTDSPYVLKFTVQEALEHWDDYVFDSPYGLAVISERDENNNGKDLLLVTDNGWSCVVSFLMTVNNGIREQGETNVYGTWGAGEGEFWNPRGIVVDPTSMAGWFCTFYVVDTGNNRIVKLRANLNDGTISFLSQFGSGYLNTPSDVTFSWQVEGGYLYVADTGNDRIAIFTTSGNYVGSILEGQVDHPMAVCYADPYTSLSDLYICDTWGGRIIWLLSGDPPTDPYWKGSLTIPNTYFVAIATDEDGGVYALDTQGCRIYTFDRMLKENLYSFGSLGVGADQFLWPLDIVVYEGEVAITEGYSDDSGIQYYWLDSEILEATASPNPFTPPVEWSLLTYKLSAPAYVDINVYKSNGQLIRCLRDHLSTPAGTRYEWWDGTDSNGVQQPSGDYYIVIDDEDFYTGPENYYIHSVDTVWVTITTSSHIQTIYTLNWWELPTFPQFSPDGSKIAFASPCYMFESDRYIWTIDADGSNPQQLTSGGDEWWPSWSPDGSHLAYAERVGLNDYLVYRMESDGWPQIRLSPETVNDKTPQWSPDGSKIAFGNFAGSNGNIWTMNASDGSGRTQITNDPKDECYPDWSPSGDEIVYEKYIDDNDCYDIWKVSLDNGATTQLTSGPDYDCPVYWLKGGDKIGYLSGKPEGEEPSGIYTMSAQNGEDKRCALRSDRVSPLFGFDTSPDKTKFVFPVLTLENGSLALCDYLRDENAFPAANITSPYLNQTVCGEVTIRGTAADNLSVDGSTHLSELEYYTITWGRGGNPNLWYADGMSLINGGTSQVQNGILGIWDTSDLEDGIYTIKLTAYDNQGDANTSKVAFHLIGPIYVPQDYPTIQEAVDSAPDICTIKVNPGIYEEQVFLRDGITLIGSGPDSCVIKGPTTRYLGVVVGANNSTIKGFTITHTDSVNICGISGDIISGFTIARNVIKRISRGIDLNSCQAYLHNNTIVHNQVGIRTTIFRDSSQCSFKPSNRFDLSQGATSVNINSNIVAYNGTGIYVVDASEVNSDYNDFYGNGVNCTPHYPMGDHELVNVNPFFIDETIDDYHLRQGSPCIDAGNPNFPLDPDGTRADIGAFYYNQGVGIKGASPPNIPTTYSFSQNYPNPFNPITEIKYDLPKSSEVNLAIYNILGQRIRTLVNEQQEAGYYTVFWNSEDERGEEVTSGIYLCRIEAGKFSQTKKLILLK